MMINTASTIQAKVGRGTLICVRGERGGYTCKTIDSYTSDGQLQRSLYTRRHDQRIQLVGPCSSLHCCKKPMFRPTSGLSVNFVPLLLADKDSVHVDMLPAIVQVEGHQGPEKENRSICNVRLVQLGQVILTALKLSTAKSS